MWKSFSATCHGAKRAIEVKEEILANLNERYDEVLNAGNGENQAYTMAVGSLGDVDELINSLCPDKDFKGEIDRYKRRNAILTAFSVMLYILGAAVLIGFEEFGYGDTKGLLILICLAAVATGILVYANMSVPYDVSVYLKESSGEGVTDRPSYTNNINANRIFSSIMSLYWTCVTIVYFFYSFNSGNWHISWLIWIIAPVFSKIIKILFEMRYGNE